MPATFIPAGTSLASPRISSELLPLVQTADGVQLNDGSALIQDAYTLQRRGDDLTFADGLTNGGKSIHGFWLRGAKQQNTIPSATTELRVAECVIPPNALVGDSSTSCFFKLQGSVNVRVAGGAYYAPYVPIRVLFYLAGAPEESSGVLRGTGVWLDLYYSSTGEATVEINELMNFTFGTGYASITGGSVANSLVKRKKLGVTAAAPWTYYSQLTTTGTLVSRRVLYNPLPLTLRCAVLCPQAAASNMFTMTVLPTAGQTVTIGIHTYTWRVTPTVAFDVRIEATIPECLTSLGYAVTYNVSVGAYAARIGTGTTSHATVTCFMSSAYEKGHTPIVDNWITFWAISTATTGASVATTTTTTGANWVNGATMIDPSGNAFHIHGFCDVRLIPVTP